MSLFRSLGLAKEAAPAKPERESDGTFYIKGQAVGESRDLRRVLALPRRPRPDDATIASWAFALKAELGRGETKCECVTKYKRHCCANLLPVQAWALTEARSVGGILGPIGVGHGKTLLDLLVSMVVPGCRTAVLLLPPNLKQQLLDVTGTSMDNTGSFRIWLAGDGLFLAVPLSTSWPSPSFLEVVRPTFSIACDLMSWW